MSWRRLAALAAVGVVALGGSVYVVGRALPVEHTAQSEITVSSSIDRVWTTITDFERAPDWRSDVERAEIIPTDPGRVRVREHGANGTVTYERDAMDAPRRLVMRIVDEGLPFGGTWTYELESATGGTRVRITEHGEIYSPLFRVVSRFVLGYTATMDGYLRDLHEHLDNTELRSDPD